MQPIRSVINESSKNIRCWPVNKWGKLNDDVLNTSENEPESTVTLQFLKTDQQEPTDIQIAMVPSWVINKPNFFAHFFWIYNGDGPSCFIQVTRQKLLELKSLATYPPSLLAYGAWILDRVGLPASNSNGKLVALLHQQMIYWKQRGTIRWIKCGDHFT